MKNRFAAVAYQVHMGGAVIVGVDDGPQPSNLSIVGMGATITQAIRLIQRVAFPF